MHTHTRARECAHRVTLLQQIFVEIFTDFSVITSLYRDGALNTARFMRTYIYVVRPRMNFASGTNGVIGACTFGCTRRDAESRSAPNRSGVYMHAYIDVASPRQYEHASICTYLLICTFPRVPLSPPPPPSNLTDRDPSRCGCAYTRGKVVRGTLFSSRVFGGVRDFCAFAREIHRERECPDLGAK